MAKKNSETSGSKLMEKPAPVTPNVADSNEEILERIQRNKNIVIGVVAAIVLLAAGWIGYNYYKNTKNAEAQAYMFPAVYHFESDSLTKALNGDGINDGLVTIADEYGMTDAGNLANFYAGVAYLKEGKFDQAIEYLKDFSSSDLLVQARAYALLGDAYMEKGQVQDAVNYYDKAANYKPNKFFTPVYLNKLAIAHEANKNNQAAIQAYDKIINEYPASAEVTNAKKYKARLEGLASK